MGENLSPLMMDLRERMVRIETKLDNHTTVAEDVKIAQASQDARLLTVEREQSRVRTLMTTTMAIAGAAFTVLASWPALLSPIFQH